MAYFCDKPEWSTCSEEVKKSIAKVIAKASNNLTTDCSGNEVLNEDEGDITFDYEVKGGHIVDLSIELFWLDRDGDMSDDGIEDRNTTAEEIENTILGNED